MPAGLHFAGVHGKLVVDIDENSHPGTEFQETAGGETGGDVMRSLRRHWRKQEEVTHE